MHDNVRAEYTISVPTSALVDGRRVTTGHRNVRITVEVDLQAIAGDLGPRAARSKRRRATGLSGRVIVKAAK